MVTFNLTVECVHISSIADGSLTTPAYTEAGWLENPEDLIAQCAVTDTKPKVFTFFQRVNGTNNCWTGQEINDGTLHDYVVRDNNLDGNWVLSVDGDPKQTPDLGIFTTGEPVGNAERRVNGDGNRADIPNLQRMNVNADWVDFDTPLRPNDNDNNWGACSADLPTELNVTQACQ